MNDADIETRELQTIAARSQAAKRRGLCAHGWVHEHLDRAECRDCGKAFASLAELLDERNAIIS